MVRECMHVLEGPLALVPAPSLAPQLSQPLLQRLCPFGRRIPLVSSLRLPGVKHTQVLLLFESLGEKSRGDTD